MDENEQEELLERFAVATQEAMQAAIALLGKKIVIYALVIIFGVLFGVLAIGAFFMTPSLSFSDSGSKVFEDEGLGIPEEGDVNYEKWFYTAENLLATSSSGKSYLDLVSETTDEYAEGYFYMTQDNLELILHKVIEYKENTLRVKNNGYKYYYHRFARASRPVSTPNLDDEGEPVLDDDGNPTFTVNNEMYVAHHEVNKDKVSYKTNASIESESVFEVSWIEIYLLAAMQSVAREPEEENWDDTITEADELPKTEVVADVRIDEETLNDIIAHFTYNFVYNFDPTLPQYDGVIFEYDDMENHAYIEVKEGGSEPVHCEEGEQNEDPNTCDNFTYQHRRLPAIAPAYGVNCYELVEYVYDSGGVLDGRWVTIDGQSFYDYAKEVIGEDFDMRWLLELLSTMPGARYDSGNSSLLDKYNLIYQSYITGEPVTYFEGDIAGVGVVKLGSGCPQYQYDPAQHNNAFSDYSIYNRTGPAYEPIECGNDLVNYAQQFLGNPYVWGGESLTNGADCSGFTMLIYKQYGYTLPHKASLQAGMVQRVTVSEAQPGDLLFRTEDGTASGVKHVAIIIGVEDGNYITVEAKSTKDGICIAERPVSRTDLFVGRLP